MAQADFGRRRMRRIRAAQHNGHAIGEQQEAAANRPPPLANSPRRGAALAADGRRGAAQDGGTLPVPPAVPMCWGPASGGMGFLVDSEGGWPGMPREGRAGVRRTMGQPA